MTKIQEKTKQNQSAFWILVHKALDKNDGQIFCLPVGNGMCRFVCDVETFCGYDCGIGGGFMLRVESALLSMPELKDTEETDPYQQVM